ncbi:MAG: DinB family protein [Acidobacteria bacterium]|nr:DinB family protein [Acidobacteriota bacterium]
MDFSGISNDLAAIVETAETSLRQFANVQTTFRPAPEKWSKKEILAHLIDSASNNHQRFVRAAIEGKLEFPAYAQDKLIALQNPNQTSWELLVELWCAYNRYLAYIIKQIPISSAGVQCSIGGSKPVTLLWLAADYVEHMKHHLNQILGQQFSTGWSLKASL